MNILPKADLLKSLEDIVKHAEAFELVVHDQQALQNTTSYHACAAQIYDYQRHKNQQSKKPCYSCVSQSHQSFERSRACLAWSKSCLNCNTKNYFANIWWQPKKSESVNALISQISHWNTRTASISAINNQNQNSCSANVFTYTSFKLFKPKLVLIFCDSGASICTAGMQHLPEFDIDERNLLHCNKTFNPA